MIIKKLSKISLVSLLFFSSFSEMSMQVIAKEVREPFSNTTEVESPTESDTKDDLTFNTDQQKESENKLESDNNNDDETVSTEQGKSEHGKEQESLPTEENLANEPPLLYGNGDISGTLDWELSPMEYTVKVAGSEVGMYEGDWFKLNGITVFCIEAKVQAYKGEGYKIHPNALSNKQEKDISLITYYGFTKSSQTFKDYMITQIMIWQYLGESLTFYSSAFESEYYTHKADINSKIAKFNAKASFNGETVKLRGIGKEYAVTLTDTNNYINDCFMSDISNDISYEKSGNKLKVWATKYSSSSVNGDMTFKLIPGEYIGEPLVYKGVSGSQGVIDARKTPDPGKTALYIEIDIHAPVRIVKKDADTGKVIKRAGTVYDIYKSNGTYVTSTTTNADGIATSSDLEYGTYYAVEKTAPYNYQINSDKINFSIEVDKSVSGHEVVSTVGYDKRVTAKSTLTKHDSVTGTVAQGDATLEGAVYGFYAAEDIYDPANDGTIIYRKDTLISTHVIKDGKATAATDYLGKYYWLEDPDRASVGYLPDPVKHEVNLIYENQNVPVVIKDALSNEKVKEQAFRIQKLTTPGTSGESPTLPEAGFTVKLESEVQRVGWENARTYDVLVTDSHGSATSKELPYGVYRVKETKVPVEHRPVEDFIVTINEDSREPQTYRYFIDEIHESKLAVIKRDAETGNMLQIAGMKFKVKCLSGNADFAAGEYVGYWAYNPLPHFVEEWETDETGAVFLEMTLKAGTYQIEEIESPEGMQLNNEPLQFKITENGWHQQTGPDGATIVTTVMFYDHPVKGQVKIDKQAELFKGYDFRETEYGKLYEPVYETGMLPNVTFEIKAKTDIIGVDGTVWYRAGQTAATLKTDGETITKSPLLPIGKAGYNLYTLQEIGTEEGCVLDDTVYTFRFDHIDGNTAVVPAVYLDEDGNEIDHDDILTVDNDRQSTLAVASKDMEISDLEDSSNAYRDVTFGFYANEVEGLEEGSLVGVSGVNEVGSLGIHLSREGSYRMSEIKTDDGFVLDGQTYPFTYEYSGDKITVIELNDGEPIWNYLKRGSIVLYKSDEDSGKGLVNVPFALATDPEFTNIIKTASTDASGKLLFEELEAGHTYYIREVYDGDHSLVEEGYVYDPTVHEVTVNDDQEVVTLNLTNKQVKGKVRFVKTGETFSRVDLVEGPYGTEHHPVWEDGSLLGAFLTVEAMEDITAWDGTEWYKKGDIVTVIESDWNAADSLLLPVGKYKAYESIEGTPHGYVNDGSVFEFEITPNGSAEIQINPVTINNNRAKVTINMKKAMEEQDVFINKDAYQSVVFGLYAREDIYDYMGNVAIENGSLIGTSGIDENGTMLETFDLPNGAYFWKELATDEQYVLIEKEFDFTIDYQGPSVKEFTIDINNGKPIWNYLKRGSIVLYKSDADSGKGLVNVPFALDTDPEFTNIIKTGSTDASGKLLFEELEAGTYYVREVYNGEHDMEAEGYVRDDTVHEVKIKDDQQIITVKQENKPVKGKVTFTKTGETFTEVNIVEGPYGTEYHPVWRNASLLEAGLSIYAAEAITTWDGTHWYDAGELVTRLNSDYDPVMSTELPVGRYYAKEEITDTPLGYINDPSVYEFEITPNGSAEIQIHPVSIFNDRAKATLNMKKTLEEESIFIHQDAYRDVVFGLYAREDIYDYMGNVAIGHDALIGTSGIDENGAMLETFDLPNGTYYWKELATNGQYVLLDREFDFSIEYQGPEVKEYTVDINEGRPIKNELIKGTVEVIKYTKDDVFYSRAEQIFNDVMLGKPKNPDMLRNPLLKDERNYLSGVPFELATDKEFANIIRTGMTDLTGRLVFDELEKGTYYIREKDSLDFYEVNDTVFNVSIDRNGQFETIDVDNNLITSYVDVKKVDFYDQSKVLPTAGFTMYSDPKCTQAIKEIKTASDGIAHFDQIKFGSTVYIKETSAPAGYELSDEVITVTIDEDWINGEKDTRMIVFPDQPLPAAQVVTGDNTITWLYLTGLITGAGMLAVLWRKRKKASPANSKKG